MPQRGIALDNLELGIAVCDNLICDLTPSSLVSERRCVKVLAIAAIGAPIVFRSFVNVCFDIGLSRRSGRRLVKSKREASLSQTILPS
jgi:hypothetical protein